MKCPNCSHDWTPDRDEVLSEYARLGGSATSRAKTKAARANAKLGGWPKGKKRGPRKSYEEKVLGSLAGQAERLRSGDANTLAHSIVAKAEKITQQGRPPQRLKVLPSPKAPKRGR